MSMSLGQKFVRKLLFFIISIFFREAEGLNLDKLPPKGPLIMVCAPHANQFLDPIMVQKTSQKDVRFLAAAVSMKRKFVGAVARVMRAIPVARPQDLAKKGTGTVSGQGAKVTGNGTLFTKEASEGGTLNAGGKSGIITKIISDTEMELKEPGLKEAVENSSFKLIPKVDQSEVYDSVYEVLVEGGNIGIFPEGGSHDRTDLLPLKAGFTVMALGALAKYPDLDLKIIPVGLNYFRAHAFRSTAYVDYGAPISIPKEMVEDYKQGGEKKREACGKLLDLVVEGIKAVTVTAPDYETLQMFQAARRLYKPAGMKLSPEKKLDLNRAFAIGYSKFKDDPEVVTFRGKYLQYRSKLRYLGFKDHQVKRIPDSNRCYAFGLLLFRFFAFLFPFVLSIPGLILSAPLFLAEATVPKKKAKEAKAASSVKVAGRDVLATWKVFIALGVLPVLWLLYTVGVVLAVIFIPHNLPLWAVIVIPIGSFFLIPILFYTTVLFVERSFSFFYSLVPLSVACFSSNGGSKLKSQRAELQQELRGIVERLGPKMIEDFEKKRIIGKEDFGQEIFTNPLHESEDGFYPSQEELDKGREEEEKLGEEKGKEKEEKEEKEEEKVEEKEMKHQQSTEGLVQGNEKND